jgi:[ribosomal protein S5]-alanine N-acetyltransferase
MSGFVDTMPQVISTARLTLRRWQLSDAEDVLAYAQDPEWSRYLHVLPTPYERRHAEEFVARQVLLNPVLNPSWAVVLDGAVVGGINLRLRPEHRLGDLGYSIARSHWNRGCTTEAAGAVVDTAFATYPDLNRIRAFADARNTASQRVMEKLGMTKEGTLRQNRVERGTFVDETWFGLLRHEWQERSGSGSARQGRA